VVVLLLLLVPFRRSLERTEGRKEGKEEVTG